MVNDNEEIMEDRGAMLGTVVRIGALVIAISLFVAIVTFIYTSSTEIYHRPPSISMRHLTEESTETSTYHNAIFNQSTASHSLSSTQHLTQHLKKKSNSSQNPKRISKGQRLQDQDVPPQQVINLPDNQITNMPDNQAANVPIATPNNGAEIVLSLSPNSQMTTTPIATPSSEAIPMQPTLRNEPVPSFEFSQRLPTFVIPEHYLLDLRTDFRGRDIKTFVNDSKETFSGRVVIQMHCQQETSYIILHSVRLVIDAYASSIYQHPSNTYIDILEINNDASNGMIFIKFKEQLLRGYTYVLTLMFSGDIHHDTKGLFRSSIREQVSNVEFSMVATFLFPTYARMLFPCFDEPWIRATFEVSITRPSQYKAITNMPFIKREEQPDGFVQDYFQQSPPMPTYLLSFVVGNLYASPPMNYHNHALGLYSISFSVDTSAYIFRIIANIIQFFEQMFGGEFPLPKLDMASVFSMQVSGMHGWGLITFQQALMFSREYETRSWEKLEIINVLSHHVAHQWIDGLVGMFWWDSLWFVEGLAKYGAYFAASAVDFTTTGNIAYTVVVNEVQAAMELDALPNTRPVQAVFETNADIKRHIKRVLYLKGTALVRMMAHIVSADLFAAAVRQFIATYAFKIATPEQFYSILNEKQVQGSVPNFVNITNVMLSWTRSVGFPLVNVTRLENGNSLLIKQYQFYYLRTGELPQQLWQIPLSYTTASEKNFSQAVPRLWLIEESKNINVQLNPDDWIIFNIKCAFYYKVNYDLNNWNLIVNQLLQNYEVIHELNRAQIIDDALDLARAGLLPYETAFSILEYLKKENSVIVWMTALDSFEKLNSVLHLSAAREKWQQFVQKIIPFHFDSISVERNLAGETLVLSKHRRDFVGVSCYYKYAPCVNRAKTLMTKVKLNFMEFFNESPSLRGVLLCAMIRDGHDDTDFHFLLAQYKSLTNYNDRSDILKALSCTRSLKLLQALMVDSLKDGDTHQVAISLNNPQEAAYFRKSYKFGEFLKASPKHINNRNESFPESASDIIMDALFNNLLFKAFENGNRKEINRLYAFVSSSKSLLKEEWLARLQQAKILLPRRQHISLSVIKALDRFV